ncbi:hypothetical protein C8R45DRAFT_1070798 [Mycena sanguinolenta]|nr:hypothetical protein C8R45DRAFT_1070798 [Mycena sanguinolenta]
MPSPDFDVGFLTLHVIPLVFGLLAKLSGEKSASHLQVYNPTDKPMRIGLRAGLYWREEAVEWRFFRIPWTKPACRRRYLPGDINTKPRREHRIANLEMNLAPRNSLKRVTRQMVIWHPSAAVGVDVAVWDTELPPQQTNRRKIGKRTSEKFQRNSKSSEPYSPKIITTAGQVMPLFARQTTEGKMSSNSNSSCRRLGKMHQYSKPSRELKKLAINQLERAPTQPSVSLRDQYSRFQALNISQTILLPRISRESTSTEGWFQSASTRHLRLPGSQILDDQDSTSGPLEIQRLWNSINPAASSPTQFPRSRIQQHMCAIGGQWPALQLQLAGRGRYNSLYRRVRQGNRCLESKSGRRIMKENRKTVNDLNEGEEDVAWLEKESQLVEFASRFDQSGVEFHSDKGCLRLGRPSPAFTLTFCPPRLPQSLGSLAPGTLDSDIGAFGAVSQLCVVYPWPWCLRARETNVKRLEFTKVTLAKAKFIFSNQSVSGVAPVLAEALCQISEDYTTGQNLGAHGSTRGPSISKSDHDVRLATSAGTAAVRWRADVFSSASAAASTARAR